jgi:diguanylate cyclase (GGDEF)-like protein
LTANTRTDDTVSRYGGDEFLYLLMEAGDKQEVRSIAEKIIAAIGQPCDFDVGKVPVRLSVRSSIGIAMFPNNGTTVDMLIKAADAAMYRAKQDKSGCAFAI